jgi:hypothetical protein
MFWIESASIGGLSPRTSDAPLDVVGIVDAYDGGARLTVVDEVNSRLVRAASVS